MSGEQNLYERFARAYIRAVRDYDQASYFGDRDKIDAALSRKQELERGIRLIVDNPRVLE